MAEFKGEELKFKFWGTSSQPPQPVGGHAYNSTCGCGMCSATQQAQQLAAQQQTQQSLTDQYGTYQYGTYGGLWQQGQWTTVSLTPPPKPTPIWQKHKREPKWHLYLGGWTLCDAGRPTDIEYPSYPYSQGWVLGTGTPLIPNASPYPNSPISPTEYLQWPHPDQSPTEEDRCEDCFAEYAALKLSDEVA